MTDREEILKALQVIKSTCEQYDDCEECPLRTADKKQFEFCSCEIKNKGYPAEWKIKPQEESWRAFRD